jgi:multiple antibiotic resistance protein
MPMQIISMAFTLWLMMDSPGNVPLYLSLLKNVPTKRVRWIIIRELLIALFCILLFASIGDALFEIIGIQQDALQISGGIILFLIAIKMIFPPERSSQPLPGETVLEPFIVPLAIPLVAGPSILTAVMVYANKAEWWVVWSAILLAWLGTVLVLASSLALKRLLGDRGLMACERLMGLVLTLMAVQMFLKGIEVFVLNCR